MTGTTTTSSTRTSRPANGQRAQSELRKIPASLNMWNRRSEDDSMMTNSGSLSTLGSQQMQGYDALDNMHRKTPMQWADDEKKSPPAITFPRPLRSNTVVGQDDDMQISSKSRRQDGNRFNSMPARRHLQAPAALSHQRNALAERNENQFNYRIEGSSASSSGTSSPEGKVASLEPLNLRQRSIKSLRGIASAWVPTSIRTPYESENETASTLTPKGKAKELQERRPIKLDRRRLNKAVSLAVEAAQASEQDQKIWKQKKKRQARQQALLKSEAESSASINRFASLPWKKVSGGIDSDLNAKDGALIAYKRKGSLGNTTDDDDDDDDDDDSIKNRKRAGLTDEELLSSDTDDSEADAIPDDFSVDLYVSSLSYLLTALSPKDVENVGPRHRQEMKRKLEEALRNLERNDEIPGVDTADREEVIRLRVERELAMMQQAYFQRQGGMSSTSSRAHQAAQASSQSRNRTQSVAGYLATSAIDLGLSVGAGALAAASRGVASLVPLLTADTSSQPSQNNKSTSSPIIEPTTIEEIIDDDDERTVTLSKPSTINNEQARPMLTSSQWELTRTLAHSVASTMYNNLAAVAEQRKIEGGPNELQSQLAVYDPQSKMTTTTASIEGRPEDASDQLLIMAATLARNVKRSPLPSQVRALTSQVVSLIGALDERYSISKRSADVALRKTGQALYYVRKNDLHVKALRAVWAVIEASVAAIEAYRDEEEWKGDVALQRGIEPRPASR